jgi:hypothetical protein
VDDDKFLHVLKTIGVVVFCAFVIWIYTLHARSRDCAKRKCPYGMQPVLVRGVCVCWPAPECAP